jgi:hypothetical protein
MYFCEFCTDRHVALELQTNNDENSNDCANGMTQHLTSSSFLSWNQDLDDKPDNQHFKRIFSDETTQENIKDFDSYNFSGSVIASWTANTSAYLSTTTCDSPELIETQCGSSQRFDDSAANDNSLLKLLQEKSSVVIQEQLDANHNKNSDIEFSRA